MTSYSGDPSLVDSNKKKVISNVTAKRSTPGYTLADKGKPEQHTRNSDRCRRCCGKIDTFNSNLTEMAVACWTALANVSSLTSRGRSVL